MRASDLDLFAIRAKARLALVAVPNAHTLVSTSALSKTRMCQQIKARIAAKAMVAATY